MSKYLFSLLLLAGFVLTGNQVQAQYYNQGIGLRIGDPLGISYKAYLQNSSAVEFVVGTTSRNRHNTYYKETFKHRDKYEDYTYFDHDVRFTLALMGRYLRHESFPANVEGRLDWYYGGGAQLRISNVEYSYFKNNQTSMTSTDELTNVDFGPEGILGVEYELQDYPVVGFAEVSLFMELVDRPLIFRAFGAVGVRYAF